MSPADAQDLPSARRFVALPVPTEVRAALAASLPRDDDRDDGLRWARPAGWHLTLAFLGDVDDARVDELVDAIGRGVSAAAHVPDRLELGEVGRFGRRVLWVGVIDEPEGSLTHLADGVRRALSDIELRIDDKPMHPHLTLARAGRRPVSAATVDACDPPPAASWRPEAIELWRSHLGRGPARYESEASIPLPTDRSG
jgi:RNA 2',3'-cyclic 3'-phosphodiesterase